MLSSEVVTKIEDFVYARPRSIQEIAQHINKNWRTADRYIQEISKEFGTLAMRTFREGTRGALKIVYWSSVEKVSSSVFQERLEAQIMVGQEKKHFEAFDIFQHVEDKKKEVWTREAKNEVTAGRLTKFKDLLLGAKKQVLFFSGNLSFIYYNDGKINLFDVVEELVKKGISIKVICRVDLIGKENIRKMLSLNFKHGKELIEIRHRKQPLRATVIDGKVINLKEVKEPTGRKSELAKKTFIFYTIKEKSWGEWLSKIFWKMFSGAIGSEKRLEEIGKLK
ncbi:hypothetical protein HOA55_02900 [archaeon]|jgi:hypothetical protein|nr:hypothetical protein [archaeon]MBT3577479.1 hypothetical protein [archaeon]MBT6820278.1 hypothetical protein [archaeon]MBT6955916.1 hypothetical protein [archaeon]MBT7025092.1 hypothetical protein [archaeon]